MFLDRTSQNVLSEWWHTVDRTSLLLTYALILIGILVCATASPAVSATIGVSPFFFFKKHIIHATLAGILVWFFSLLTPKQIQLLSLPAMAILILVLLIVPLYGMEIKGARRWLTLYGMQMQPSELIRPWLAVITAWLLDKASANKKAYLFLGLICAIVVGCIMAQPDIGMAVMIAAVWISQLFVSKVRIIWIASLCSCFLICGATAYYTLPHVQQRISSFLHKSDGSLDHYQISKSIDAFSNGGLLGMGPGQGVVKNRIPDSHADFVFAVIGEEFGLILCISIMLIFLVKAIRCTLKACSQEPAILCTVIGLISQLQIQLIVNIGVAIRLLPTTGVTLPLISYGGSSMLASGATIGIVLAFTRSGNKKPRLHFT